MNDFLKNHFDILKKNFLNPDLELRLMLSNCSIKKKNVFLNDFDLNDINLIKFKEVFQRRLNREPISKIFNKKIFFKEALEIINSRVGLCFITSQYGLAYMAVYATG